MLGEAEIEGLIDLEGEGLIDLLGLGGEYEGLLTGGDARLLLMPGYELEGWVNGAADWSCGMNPGNLAPTPLARPMTSLPAAGAFGSASIYFCTTLTSPGLLMLLKYFWAVSKSGKSFALYSSGAK